MGSKRIPGTMLKRINSLVEQFEEQRYIFEQFAKTVATQLGDHPKLRPYYHSIKYRVKDAEHLRGKLIRKAKEAIKARESFGIDRDNLFSKIEDLAGVRILHLHSDQIRNIDAALKFIFDEERYELLEGPIANTWDDEYRNLFKQLMMSVRERNSLYTSVHYVIGSNNKYQTRCEIQVRTLSEEVWGEVSHIINYPEFTRSIACQEQIKVLARVTSSCTRLVDSIFRSESEYISTFFQQDPNQKKKVTKDR